MKVLFKTILLQGLFFFFATALSVQETQKTIKHKRVLSLPETPTQHFKLKPRTLSPDDTCAICFDNVAGDQKNVVLCSSPYRQHPYHTECLKEWITKNDAYVSYSCIRCCANTIDLKDLHTKIVPQLWKPNSIQIVAFSLVWALLLEIKNFNTMYDISLPHTCLLCLTGFAHYLAEGDYCDRENHLFNTDIEPYQTNRVRRNITACALGGLIFAGLYTLCAYLNYTVSSQ